MPFILLPLLLLLAACAGTQGTARGPYAPAGVPRGETSVDGLIVGHRLMAAGEAELALKAYLLAASEHGTTVDVLSALGSANLALGRLGQAETLLRRAVRSDAAFAPAWNNLGVVLMERGEIAEAARVFRTAVALDSGQSDEIRGNLSLALEKSATPDYPDADNANFALVRRGTGSYLILPRG
ncbi:tetratricopeptide repeat protein [Profundibacterium mesophilum]|uniref:Polypeptide N-acetylglucosaminyltransferase n=1 Tax=Profundibacterium mesophilum KAUST100406-0324 TaxID=1037889 RepID=A0A921NUN4_9RHOB|nr:tetratricopeptide repeat protein [Profundibacterium mesophilum]KAF0675820.1 polypeptide N-acetylglucosaminyltransferase [Profundibacterium mesophilum KAUST100406-0324]